MIMFMVFTLNWIICGATTERRGWVPLLFTNSFRLWSATCASSKNRRWSLCKFSNDILRCVQNYYDNLCHNCKYLVYRPLCNCPHLLEPYRNYFIKLLYYSYIYWFVAMGIGPSPPMPM